MRKLLSATAMILAVAMVMPASAADLAPVEVFADGRLDDRILLEATPPWQDLVAGYIGETDKTIDFTWKVADIPDVAPPEINTYFWEFTLTPPNQCPEGSDPTCEIVSVPFSLRAYIRPVERSVGIQIDGVSERAPSQARGVNQTEGQLQGNCTNTNNVISCTTVPGSIVEVTVDPVTDTITAHVRRRDLIDNSGTLVGVDGAELAEIDIFDGISAFTSVGVSSANMGDPAEMEDVYILGSPRTTE